jgi:hypothetical protein
MKLRSIAIGLAALCLAGAAVCLAVDTTLGTWKLNDAKSKIPAGGPKNTMVVYTMVGDSIKVTIDGLDGTGKPTHSEWTGKFDGKEYPVTGDTTSDTRSYKKIDDHTLEVTSKMGGKVELTARIVVSADGKTRTVTVHSTDMSGKKITSVAVYDKQ